MLTVRVLTAADDEAGMAVDPALSPATAEQVAAAVAGRHVLSGAPARAGLGRETGRDPRGDPSDPWDDPSAAAVNPF